MNIKKSTLIYVVEDNLIFNRIVCEHLKKLNYTNIKSFVSGNDCIKAVMEGENPDIVIQDYFLEDLNGIDVLKAVKAKSKNSEFIFLTVNDNIEIALDSIKYGAKDYILKDKGDVLKKLEDKVYNLSREIMTHRKNKTIMLTMIVFLLILSIIIISGLLLFVFGYIKRA
jgi:DNA-binding NtrC family response regulator